GGACRVRACTRRASYTPGSVQTSRYVVRPPWGEASSRVAVCIGGAYVHSSRVRSLAAPDARRSRPSFAVALALQARAALRAPGARSLGRRAARGELRLAGRARAAHAEGAVRSLLRAWRAGRGGAPFRGLRRHPARARGDHPGAGSRLLAGAARHLVQP